jgi:hypothetical protein
LKGFQWCLKCSRAQDKSLEIFELDKLGFWRNSYFQIKGVKIKEEEKKRGVISPMIYSKIFGVHNFELGSEYAT